MLSLRLFCCFFGLAVALCPSGKYELKNSCFSCDLSCSECSGPGGRRCTSCPPGSFKEQTSCVASCSRGFFSSEDEREDIGCFACNNNCRTCVGPLINQCSSCYANQFHHSGGDQDQQCLPRCASGYAKSGPTSCSPTSTTGPPITTIVRTTQTTTTPTQVDTDTTTAF